MSTTKDNSAAKVSAAKATNAISPTRADNYPEWYQQVVKAADMAEISPARGCMVIKPWGYALWENMQRILDKRFKETGHQNAYFPLFIPKSFLEKEAQHVAGFAKECAVVTHHRLEQAPDGSGLIPVGPLSEPYIVRPTSETIIGEMFAKWVRSHRDLPLLINQWANVVRWEMRTRLFLRTTEFLWQEGHTVHATEKEAREEALRMFDVYRDFYHDYMAIPLIRGEKTESERFPGAVNTYTIEPMMQDRKALQGGTSHFLGQNFARASEIKFLDQDREEKYGWTTSWGVSTRIIGALIMVHADDNGMVMPPRLAPTQIVISPMIHKEGTERKVMEYCQSLVEQLQKVNYLGRELQVHLDTRDMRGGEKVWSWIKKGAPIIMEIGPRDVDNDAVFFTRRDHIGTEGKTQKISMPRTEFVAKAVEILEEMQKSLFARANDFLIRNTFIIDSKEDFYKFFTPQNSEQPEIHGGFALTHWCGDPAVEEKIKADLNVTIRCIPFEDDEVYKNMINHKIKELDQSSAGSKHTSQQNIKGPGVCPFSGKPSPRRVLFAKSY